MPKSPERTEAERQAKEAGVLLLILLGLRPTRLRVGFDARRGRYIVDGKLLAISDVLKLSERIEKAGVKNARRLTQAMLDGKIDIDTWRASMRRLIGAQHLLQAALAFGSLDMAEASPETRQRMADEDRYLVGFASGLRAGQVSPGRALARAASYMMAAALTFHIVNQFVQGGAGKREAKRIRRATESCPGCLIYAGRWMPIQLMPPIGSLDCGSHCRCYLIYR